MKHEALPEDDAEPDDVVLKNIGEVAIDIFGQFEHDPFIDDLKGRSIWDYPEDAP